MKSSALILCAALVCALGVACEPVAPTPQLTAAVSAHSGSTTPACDDLRIRNGNDFVDNKVLILSPSYDPTNGTAPSAGQIVGPVAQNSPYRRHLAAAFRIAPDFFKNQLCSVTYVFLVQCADAMHCTADDAARNSWGLREWRGAKSGRFMAISAALWQSTDSALPLDQFGTKRLMSLLRTLSPGTDLYLRVPICQSGLPRPLISPLFLIMMVECLYWPPSPTRRGMYYGTMLLFPTVVEPST